MSAPRNGAAKSIDAIALIDAFVWWRATGSTRALADLVPHAEIAALLRDDDGLRSKGRRNPDHFQTKVRARASVLLISKTLGETRHNVLAGCVARMYYGKNPPVPTIAKIVKGELLGPISKEAKALEKWILESSSAETHLDRLRAVLATSTILDITSTNLDADDADAAD